MRQVLSKYRDVARLSFGRIPAGPQTALLSEWLFTLLQPVGIPDRAIAYIGDIAGLYVGAFCFEESLGYCLTDRRRPATRTDRPDDAGLHAVATLATVSPARWRPSTSSSSSTRRSGSSSVSTC